MCLKKVAFLFSFLIVALLLAPNHLLAQVTEVRGKVIDGKTKEPLGYANVRLKGTITGSNADGDGFYILRTVEKTDTLVVSYLGYPTRYIAIKRGRSQELTVEMGSENIQLNEVQVKAGKRKRYIDTVANYVYYKVLQHKDENRADKIDNYQLEEYNKFQIGLLNPKKKFINLFLFKPFRFVFDNLDTVDENKVYIRGVLKEDLIDVSYRKKPNAIRKVTKASQFTGVENTSVGDIAMKQFEKTEVYDNIYVIQGKSFVAPFAPGAIITYRYFITDTQKIEGRTTYKLHFVGKSKVDLALKGHAWIDSATWAVQRIFFRPNEKANLNFLKDYTVSQTYQLIDNKSWMLKSEDLETEASIFKRKKNQMAVLVQKHVDRRNIRINIPLSDTLFKESDQDITLPDAREKTREYWDSSRFTPLNNFEKKVIFNNDTIPKVHAFKAWMWTLKLLTTAYFEAGPIEFGRFYKFVSRNNIEGWRIRFGGQTNKKLSKTFNINAYGAYGLKDKDFKYQVIFKTFLPTKNDRWRALNIYYKYDMNILGQENPLLTFDNFFTIFSGRTLTKIMKIREWNIDVENDWRKGFSSIISLNNKTYYSIPGIFDFEHKNKNGTSQYLPNFSTMELGIDSRLAFHDQYYKAGWYRWFITTKYPVIKFRYQLGFLSMNGKVTNYNKLLLTINQRLQSAVGYTKYQFQAGKIFGTSPYPVSFVTAGNFGYFFDKYNYNMLREFEFVTDQYLSLWVEHHFDGYFFNKIPIVNRLQMREVIYFKSLWGTYSKKNAELITPIPGTSSPYPIPYIEVGFGIENILKVLRVDFIWRATHRDVPGVPNWGVKFSINPNF